LTSARYRPGWRRRTTRLKLETAAVPALTTVPPSLTDRLRLSVESRLQTAVLLPEPPEISVGGLGAKSDRIASVRTVW
jgi:hypothetical protein